MVYDCIIIGCGVSGSISAYLLARQGFSVLAIEKLPKYGEKICGGWISHRSISQLRQIDIDANELLFRGAASIKHGKIFQYGDCEAFDYAPDQFSIGTTRNNFDVFLSEQAMNAGAKYIFGEYVKEVSQENELYLVNGHYARKVILAIGARQFNKDAVLNQIPAFGISELVVGKSKIKTDTFYFYYDIGMLLPMEGRNALNYFWIIPVSVNTWNIGMGFLTACKNMYRQFKYCKERYAVNLFENMKTILEPRGNMLGTVDFSGGICPYHITGDFSGTCNPETGEGILNAILSGIQVANEVTLELKNKCS
ncbi:NAD(P)/FAD-dependent oxidoreductase [Lacrimispora algidixylanolytica]|uniref:FAD-binding domain-containing protein n=1 Tax=Lacrimispora algidixylanolytica TaxID=94868 RepID=A0A419T2R9_9FIRM|nr:NAD(P)/FAD-dependent oxidoreductase [Lacrimispora algidixylanolytica]RKD31752.1 hypothetical protein BET01_19735 [Lacrimispora algidixylanolytica]